MIVFFIILTILFFISLFFLIICLSNLEIEINDLWVDSENYQKIGTYLFCIRLKLLDKITWFKIRLDNKKIENSKIFNSKVFNKYENVRDVLAKNKKEIFKKRNIKYIKELKLNVKELNLYMDICTSNSIFTSFIVVIVTSLISIILARNIEKYEKSKYKYKINPKFEKKPSIKIKLDCIINVKIVHIMNVIYMLIKKRSVEYDKRTSDRRTYVCSHGKYSRYG